VRVVLLGAVGVAAAIYALVRHYTHPPVPMHVTPSAAPTYDADAGETPVPDIQR
jgi:hypothetical protein